jgi:recombination protein RecA
MSKDVKKLPDEDKIRRAILEKIRRASTFDEDEIRFADEKMDKIDVISTGFAELDKILTPDLYEKSSQGGIPRGYVCEFFGPYAGGKSSLGLMLAATVTKAGGYVFWVDAENSFVDDWAKKHGVDTSHVVKAEQGKGRSGEDFLTELDAMCQTGVFSLAVVDSVAGLAPKAILEAELAAEARVGAQARMLSRALPKLIGSAKQGNTAVIFINQIRMKIGVMYGNPETTPGGEALKFFSSLRVRLSQVGSRKDRGIVKEGEEIGIRSNIQVVKSRFGPPFREIVLPIYFTADRPKPIELLLDMALTSKVIRCRTKKRGEDSVQSFSLEGFDKLSGVEGLDDFKEKLDVLAIREIAKRLEDMKIALMPDVRGFVEGLSADDPLGDHVRNDKTA